MILEIIDKKENKNKTRIGISPNELKSLNKEE